jgi:hypothetical protein
MPFVRVRTDWPVDWHQRTLLGQRTVLFRKQGAEQVSDAELAEIVTKFGHALEQVEQVKPGVWKRPKPQPLDMGDDAGRPPVDEDTGDQVQRRRRGKL